jgi:hypothetical protein
VSEGNDLMRPHEKSVAALLHASSRIDAIVSALVLIEI